MRSETWAILVQNERRIDLLAAGAAFCAAPLSIAVSESLLTIALCARMFGLVRQHSPLSFPRVFWPWLGWALLEVAAWLHSPEPAAGKGEMRHLLLIVALFILLPVLNHEGFRLRVWKGLFITATIGSATLIAGFAARVIRHHHEVSMGGDPAYYFRDGGLLHHWMIFATVEILVFGALLEFRASYPEARRWTRPAMAIQCVAILVSLTRCLWIAALLLWTLHLFGRRARWRWIVPALPLAAYLITAGPIRQRMVETLQPEYYSNAERVQMLRVGWQMIREHPWLGVGPGRVEKLYTRYLSPGEPVPAYHGHLHNNVVQIAAQFGVPTLLAALLFLTILLVDLWRNYRRARDREQRFLSRSAFLGIAGFLVVGMMDYTYGHSLGLILFSFAAISPLLTGTNRRASVHTCIGAAQLQG